jgi:hypothetical protein
MRRSYAAYARPGYSGTRGPRLKRHSAGQLLGLVVALDELFEAHAFHPRYPACKKRRIGDALFYVRELVKSTPYVFGMKFSWFVAYPKPPHCIVLPFALVSWRSFFGHLIEAPWPGKNSHLPVGERKYNRRTITKVIVRKNALDRMATARELLVRHRVQQLPSAGFRESAAQLNAFDVYCLCRERRPLDGPARRKHRHLFDSPISDVESCWVTLLLLVEQSKNCAIWDELREIRFLGKRRMAEVAKCKKTDSGGRLPHWLGPRGLWVLPDACYFSSQK